MHQISVNQETQSSVPEIGRTPRILSPLDGVENSTYTIVASATIFDHPDLTQRHLGSEWEISQHKDFSEARLYSIYGHGNSVKLTNLDSSATYYVRVRQYGETSKWTAWSDAVKIETMPFNGNIAVVETETPGYSYGVACGTDGVICVVGTQRDPENGNINATFSMWSNINGILSLIEHRVMSNGLMEKLHKVASIDDRSYVAVGCHKSSERQDVDFLITLWVFDEHGEGNLLLADKKIYGSLNIDVLLGIAVSGNRNYDMEHVFVVVGQSGRSGYISSWEVNTCTGNLEVHSEALLDSEENCGLVSVAYIADDMFVAVGKSVGSDNDSGALITLWKLDKDKKLILLDQKKLSGDWYHEFNTVAVDSKKRIYAAGSCVSNAPLKVAGIMTRWLVHNEQLHLDIAHVLGEQTILLGVTVDAFDRVVISGASNTADGKYNTSMLGVLDYSNPNEIKTNTIHVNGYQPKGFIPGRFESVCVNQSGIIVAAGNNEGNFLFSGKFNVSGFSGRFVSGYVEAEMLSIEELTIDALYSNLIPYVSDTIPALEQGSLVTLEEDYDVKKTYY